MLRARRPPPRAPIPQFSGGRPSAEFSHTTGTELTTGNAFEALASLIELVLIAFLFPLVILVLGLPVVLLVRLVLEIMQRL